MSAYERRTCDYPDCTRLTRNKGFARGKGGLKRRYDRFCGWHHRKADGTTPSPYFLKNQLPNKTCEKCGWDQASCDRHRKVRDRGYTRENVIILCPNCHRLAHLGLLEIS
jgi:hypothetical protein